MRKELDPKEEAVQLKAALAKHEIEGLRVSINREREVVRIEFTKAKDLPYGVVMAATYGTSEGKTVLVIPFSKMDMALRSAASGSGRYQKRALDLGGGEVVQVEYVTLQMVGVTQENQFTLEAQGGQTGTAGVVPFAGGSGKGRGYTT